MKPKKTNRSNLERKTSIFLLTGLAISVLLVITAFEWTFYDKKDFKLKSELMIDDEMELPDVTKQQKKPPPPPPPPEIKVVRNDVEVEEDQPDVFKSEIDESETITLPPAEEEETVGQEEKIFLIVEDEPTFPGGEAAMYDYISDHIQYPEREKKFGIEGLVTVSFVVNQDGSLSDFKVLQAVNDNLAKEALRVVRNMPDWKPGKQRGRAVRVRVTLPIRFTLQG